MSDISLEFATERALGAVRGRVRLGSALTLPDGARARASLVLCDSGLWLLAARDRFHGSALDLLNHGDLRLVAGRFRDRLCFGHEEVTIPAGRRHAVERLIARGRLATKTAAPPTVFRPSRFLHAPDELGKAWLVHVLADSEVLIGWLRSSEPTTIASAIVGQTRCPSYLFLTDQRAAIVGLSAVGDVSYVALPEGAPKARAKGDKTELAVGGVVFTSSRGDAEACRDLAELHGLAAGKARLLEAARRLWLGRERGPDGAAPSLSLLDAAREQGSQRARFARLLASVEDLRNPPELGSEAVALALASGPLTPTGLVELWTTFRFSARAGSALVRGLLDAGDAGLPFALELQRRVRGTPSADEGIARDELRLAHFAVESRLADATPKDERDLQLRAVLAPHGLSASPQLPLAVGSPLSRELIDNTLTHPAARGQGSLVATVQKLIAQSPEPDHAALSDYCEALDTREHPEARRALDAARLAFSLKALHAYVSRGQKSIGLRGYEAKVPYLLLGKGHLDPSSPFRMSEAELFFAIGSEALHLKLGQARLTSSDVWAGAFAHTRGGVELLLGFLPLVKGLPLAASATKFLDKIPEPALRRGLEVLTRFEQGQKKKPPLELGAPSIALSHINEELVAAHRLMQMSADRAGLALSGDLRASLRALLMVRPDTARLLDGMVDRDLLSVLLDCDAEAALRADLIVRIAALLEFYLSPDYLTLRRALVLA